MSQGNLLADFGYVGLLLIVTLFFAVSALLIPLTLRFLRIAPHRPDPVKLSTYECGMETVGKTWIQFNFRYYFYALLFVIFDVLIVFLLPWATNFKKLGFFSFVTILFFLLVMSIGYVYAWRKGALEWK